MGRVVFLASHPLYCFVHTPTKNHLHYGNKPDLCSTRRTVDLPIESARPRRTTATTTTVYSHAHAHHHTMFTVRASAQKTTVAVDARAAKKADAKRYARPTTRPRDIRIATRTDPDDGTDRSIDPNDATRARETRRVGVTVFYSVARRIRR